MKIRVQTWTRPSTKSELPPGPWQDEPDKAVWVDPDTGLDCLINRSRMGNWCGYVGVAEGHPLFGYGYSEHVKPCPTGEPESCWDCPTPERELSVHGGLTFAAACQETEDPAEGICHAPEAGRPAHIWWFGFDCAHSGDLVPTMYRSLPASLREGEQYRDLDYVRSECADLAKQVAAWT